MTLKVLHVYKTYYPETCGGIEHLIKTLIHASAKEGIQAEVFAITLNGKTGIIKLDNVSVHRHKAYFQISNTPFSCSAFWRFSRLAKQFDVIHYHVPFPFGDLLHFVSCVKKPSLVTYHSDIVKQRYAFILYRPLLYAFLSNVDTVIATSSHYLKSSPVLSSFKEKTRVITLGLDTKAYPTASKIRVAEYQKRFGGRFFLFLGVLRYYKGLDYLLRACVGRDYPVVIAGFGPEYNRLREEVKRLGLKNIHFLGEVSHDEKVALLSACYAYIFPSHLRSEAFGLSLLEAAMFGKAMICCALDTGTTVINEHDQTGLVVPPADHKALRVAMDALWNDPEKALTMGQAALSRFQHLFTAKKMVSDYIDLYKKLSQKIKS